MPQSESTSSAVSDLQRFLRQLSYHDPAIPAPPVDGIFDSATRRSLEAFQKRYDLPVTGVADQVTCEALYAAYRNSLAETGIPREMAVFPRTRKPTVLLPGGRGFPVAAIQLMLWELEFDGDAPLEITGEYNEATEKAVKRFQRHASLPVTGSTDLFTWNLLTDQYNLFFSRASFL